MKAARRPRVRKIQNLLSFIFGCGSSSGEQKPQSERQKAKPISDAAKPDHPPALAADDKFVYFVTGGTVASRREGTNNVMKLPIGGKPAILFEGGDAVKIAAKTSKFWLGEQEIVFKRSIDFSIDGLFKIAKTGGDEIELDRGGYVADLFVGKDRIFLSDIVRIFELAK